MKDDNDYFGIRQILRAFSFLRNPCNECRVFHVAHYVLSKWRSMLMKAIDLALRLSASFPSGNLPVIVVCSDRALRLLCIHLASIHLQDPEHSLL